MEHLIALILAAGEGKRMKSKNAKVVHKICGKAMIEWVAGTLESSGIKDRVFVVGHRADQVRACFGDGENYVLQEKQLGTGHAVAQARKYLEGKKGLVVVLYGDMPLIKPETVLNLVKSHKENNNHVTVVTAQLADPTGYGRIIRNSSGDLLRSVEERDANQDEKRIKEVNTGIFCFNIRELLDSLDEMESNNSQGEYYLTDMLEIFLRKGLKAGTISVADAGEVMGINDRIQLAEASSTLRKRILDRFMKSGVTILDPYSTYIDDDVKIGIDTVIYPGTIIENGTAIGEDCLIGPNSRISGSMVGRSVEIVNSVVMQSSIDDGTHIGPFAYLRPGSRIGMEVKIGDFVEIKNSSIGDKSKVSHLTYVGDSDIGRNVNLGCGVVTVNYDGRRKSRTVIEDDAFVGCNVNLIAPVMVKSNSYIAAGSTITGDVPENALAIARARQEVKEDWVLRKGMGRRKNKDD